MPGSFSELDHNKHSLDSEEYPKSPHYISARSADVILSDIRPTNFSSDALNSINALLDELLHSILSAARALSTAQLRAALHKVLPTTLGKEAVLEAEMELRAFWERTGGSGSSQTVVDGSGFNLQWVFEVSASGRPFIHPASSDWLWCIAPPPQVRSIFDAKRYRRERRS
jgi:hypothetical protein